MISVPHAQQGNLFARNRTRESKNPQAGL